MCDSTNSLPKKALYTLGLYCDMRPNAQLHLHRTSVIFLNVLYVYALCVLSVCMRGFEFAHLNVTVAVTLKWQTNVYTF